MPAPTALPMPALHPFVGIDVPWLLREQARTAADRTYLIWDPFEGEGCAYTYAEFARRGGSVRRRPCRARGLRKGDFFLIHLGNCAEFLIAWHACSRLGAVAVTTNTRSSPDELAYFADNCGAVAALTQPAFVDLLAAAAPRLRFMAVTDTDQGAAPAAFHTAGRDSVRGDRRATRPTCPSGPHDPLDFNSVQYTSGTTARPKGVVWTHANVLWGARLTATLLQLRPEDVGFVFFPLFHTNALMYSSLATPLGGRLHRGDAEVFGEPLLDQGAPPRLHLVHVVAVHAQDAGRHIRCPSITPFASGDPAPPIHRSAGSSSGCRGSAGSG